MLQSEAKWAPKGPQGCPKCSQMCKKITLGNSLERKLGPKWPKCPPGLHFEWILSDFEVHFNGILVGYFLCLLGLGMASAAKAQQKISNPCTSKSRNLELHSTISIFLLAASLNFHFYWRAFPSFPVLANTGSGKLWLAQRLKVFSFKHPQGFREGGVRGGRELGHLRGRPPWPFEAHFAQKVSQRRSHELPLPKNLQTDGKRCWQ